MPGWLRDGSVWGEICFDKMDGGSVIASEIALGAQHPGGREGKHVEGGPQKVLLSFLKLTVKEREVESTAYNSVAPQLRRSQIFGTGEKRETFSGGQPDPGIPA